MERILVGMNTETSSFWAGIHALNLAKRIRAKIFFLLVLDPRPQGPSRAECEIAFRKRLEPLIEDGRSEGMTVEYYLTHGDYEKELVNFAQENGITLLVIGFPAEQHGSRGSFRSFLERIRHRLGCRIEVVQEKGVASDGCPQGGGNVAPLSPGSGE